MKKLLLLLLNIMLILNLNVMPVTALSEFKVVVIKENGTLEKLATKGTYNDAYAFYLDIQDQYPNAGILKDDEYIYVKNGVVIFSGKCNETISYTNALNNESGYTNACYGADALFLGINASGSRIKFQLSGVIGFVDAKNVSIKPIEDLNNVSSYVVKDDDLIHQIKTNMQSLKYAALLNNGKAPHYLTPSTTYYSYDGHYFYDTFAKMVQDVRNTTTVMAINANDPYYNFYQYVPHRFISNYSPDDLNTYLKDILGINKSIDHFYDTNNDLIFDIITQSQFYDAVPAFFEAQSLYGSNALMMLSLAMNEAAFGRSALAFTRNNLFGHAAYDSNVESNASRYQSVTSSIISHAKNFISNTYANKEAWQYRGSFFGNKGSGMNVSYASDPYWGEKAAQYYLKIDRQLGSKDFESIKLGIKENIDSLNIYTAPNLQSKVLYTSGKHNHFAFIILEEVVVNKQTWYKIQSDPTFNNEGKSTKVYNYDFEKNIGYIQASAITSTLFENKIAPQITYAYDANGGEFSDKSTTIKLKQTSNNVSLAQMPTKDNSLFDKWVLEGTTFKATYHKIKEAFILGGYKTLYDINTYINMKDMNYVFILENNERITIPITSSMCSKMYLKELGNNTITISYGGISREITLFVSEQDSAYQDLLYADLMAISNQEKLEKADLMQMSNFISELVELEYPFTKEDLFKLDTLIQDSTNKLQVIIDKNKFNLGITGLSVYLPYDTITKDLIPNVLKLSANALVKKEQQYFSKVVTGNTWKAYDGFKLTATYLKEDVNLLNDYEISINKPSFDDNSQLYIILALKDDEIYRLYGNQTLSSIVFNTSGFDTFFIAYQDTSNEYINDDQQMLNRVDNNGKNYRTLTLIYALVALFIFVIIIIVCLMQMSLKNKKIRIKKHKRQRIRKS